MKKLEADIMSLFMKLIGTTPAMIENKCLYYNIDGEVVSITWYTKREKDNESPISSLHYKSPFKDCSIRNRNWFSICTEWSICNAAELEGYTFYINTLAGQLRVPELSRRQLVDVQEIIENHYKEFVPKYVDKLLSIPVEQYGEVTKSRSYDHQAK